MKSTKQKVYSYLLVLFFPFLMCIFLFLTEKEKIRFKDYYKYKFPLKTWGNFLNSYAQINFFKKTNIGNIHIGKSGWVFYMSPTDGSSVDDFFAKPFPDLMDRWDRYFSQTVIKPFGFSAKYLFLSPPNKQTLYPEMTSYMFTSLITRDKGNYSQLHKLMGSKYRDNFVPLFQELVEGKSQGEVYHSGDTHWTDWGAYISHQSLIKASARSLATEFKVVPYKSIERSGEAHADILKMFNGVDHFIGYSSNPGVNTEVVLERLCCQTPIVSQSDYILYQNNQGQKIVWFLGDSFSDRLKKYLPLYFSKVAFVRFGPHLSKTLKELVQHGSPDLIIEEHVERYLYSAPDYIDLSR